MRLLALIGFTSASAESLGAAIDFLSLVQSLLYKSAQATMCVDV